MPAEYSPFPSLERATELGGEGLPLAVRSLIALDIVPSKDGGGEASGEPPYEVELKPGEYGLSAPLDCWYFETNVDSLLKVEMGERVPLRPGALRPVPFILVVVVVVVVASLSSAGSSPLSRSPFRSLPVLAKIETKQWMQAVMEIDVVECAAARKSKQCYQCVGQDGNCETGW